MRAGSPGRPVAFFDVDETLLTTKSMIAFGIWWADNGGPSALRLHDLLGSDLSREAKNRAYYQGLAGIPRHEFLQAGQRWYRDHQRQPQAFVTPALQAFDRHRAAGHATVLVSGSHHACLDPLAQDLGADAILCTELHTGDEGSLTGTIRRSMIGNAKAQAVAQLLDRWPSPADACFAYGDHTSDLPFLRLVGHPTVVGNNPQLLQHARLNGWSQLPLIKGPKPPRSSPAHPAAPTYARRHRPQGRAGTQAAQPVTHTPRTGPAQEPAPPRRTPAAPAAVRGRAAGTCVPGRVRRRGDQR